MIKKTNSLFFILLIVIVFFGGAESVSAAILNPYVVNEKPRVLFGDSAQLPDYYGLENYVQDYVDDFTHITFTYTHNAALFY